jgi:hypothetical protein
MQWFCGQHVNSLIFLPVSELHDDARTAGAKDGIDKMQNLGYKATGARLPRSRQLS